MSSLSQGPGLTQDASADGSDGLQPDGDAGSNTDAASPALDASVEEDAASSDDAGPACSTDKVDLLFVIDSSGSMSEEQVKLAAAVPELLAILATGNRNGMPSAAGAPTDFGTAESVHIGVISADLALNTAPALTSCGSLSFSPTDPDPIGSGIRVDKPFGDDAVLLNSTAVAVAGVSIRQPGTTTARVLVPPDPSCASVVVSERYLVSTPDVPQAETNAAFSCISKLGRNGCGFEQPFEAMLKALTPSDSAVYSFSRGSQGQGTTPGANAGFLRSDAVLAVIVITDEDDCSLSDANSALFDTTATSVPGDLDVRCGLTENQSRLHPISRFAQGLLGLKPEAYRRRILLGGIAGIPLGADTQEQVVHEGSTDLNALLMRSDMQFQTQPNASGTSDEAIPVCDSVRGDGSAAPARRIVELAAALDENGLATSICEDSYEPFIVRLGERIATELSRCD